MEAYNTNLEHLLSDATDKSFVKFQINKKIFDDSINELSHDPEISSIINSLATVDEEYIHRSI
jgi:hypothetical protein